MGSEHASPTGSPDDGDAKTRLEPDGSFRPITDFAELRTLDEGEVLDGYRCGVHGQTCPAGMRSRAHWHGWRVGMIDRGALEPDDAARALAAEAAARRRRDV